MNPYELLGKTLYGFCAGYFGRDSYNSKVVEVVGHDYIVYREDGIPDIIHIENWESFMKDALKWQCCENED